MRNILFAILLINLCTCTLSAQKSAFFKIDTLSSGALVLSPLMDENPYTDSGKPVYTKSNFGDLNIQVYCVLMNSVSEDTWLKMDEKEKINLMFVFTFGVDGNVMLVNVFMSEGLFHVIPEIKWSEICEKLKQINILPYITIPNYEKDNFTFSRVNIIPFRYVKRYPEKLE